jgi:hypothetical protein
MAQSGIVSIRTEWHYNEYWVLIKQMNPHWMEYQVENKKVLKMWSHQQETLRKKHEQHLRQCVGYLYNLLSNILLLSQC